MFLRRTERKKNGKAHSYWNVVENKRLDDGRVVQRHVLYLGEINSSQAAAWRKAIEVFDENSGRSRTLTLFPEDRCDAIAGDASVVQLRLSEMRLHRPRQWGACWLAGQLWQELQLDRFWADRLPPNWKGTRWDQVLQVLASYRLIAQAANGGCITNGSATPGRTDRHREKLRETTVTVPVHPAFAESLRAARAAGIIGADVFTGKMLKGRVVPMNKKAWAGNRLHHQHPHPPTSLQSKQRDRQPVGGQFWTPIPRLRGTILQAE